MGRFPLSDISRWRSIELQSKSGQSLTRYFPELVTTVASLKAKRFVPDGEIVVPSGRHLRRPAAADSPRRESREAASRRNAGFADR
jgi:ATP-dependent DNA ligase